MTGLPRTSVVRWLTKVDVALKYGYDSPESFSKAFRKIHGIAPSEARHPGVSLKAFPRISFHLSLRGDKDMDYRIMEKEAFTVVGKSFQTTFEDGEQTRQIPRFWEESHRDGTTAKLGSIGTDENLLGICLDMQPGKEDLTYMIASQTDLTSHEEGFSSRTIPASTWAIFTSVGPMPGAIQSVIGRIFQEWFPATGYEHAGAPELEVYPPGGHYGRRLSVRGLDSHCEKIDRRFKGTRLGAFCVAEI
jgi:AraC family transcriptional regulator